MKGRRYPRPHRRPGRIGATLRDPRRAGATARLLGRVERSQRPTRTQVIAPACTGTAAL
jgi:hypothetical protein